MANRGGINALQGIRYQLKAALYYVPAVLREEAKAIRYEPRSADLSPKDPPTHIHLDDFSILYSDGRKLFAQAKSTESHTDWTVARLHGEGVLRQLAEQHADDSHAILLFVSNARSTCLEALSNRARECISSQEFLANLSEKLRRELEEISGKTARTPDFWWSVLKRAKVVLLTEDYTEEQIRNYASDRYSDVDKFVAVLKRKIEENPGALLTKQSLLSALENAGLFQLVICLSEPVTTIFRRASSRLRAYPDTIAGRHIARDEVGALHTWCTVKAEGNAVGFLLDDAGTGKTVILSSLLKRLEADNIPVLAVKADALDGVKDPDTLQKALGLPAPPEQLLATAAAKAGRAVLLVDQLDALSMTFVRERDCLETLVGLMARATAIRGVVVVASCRAFDYQFDPKLRSIKAKEGFRIKPLTDEQVRLVLDPLGIDWKAFTEDEKRILRIPHHLDLLYRARSARPAETGRVSVHGLYDALWSSTVQAPNAPPKTTEALYLLVDRISRSQILTQPVSALDGFRNESRYLQSTGLIRITGNMCSLFHQGFFDYCWARRFVHQGGSISETIRGTPQGFFERPQVLQVLTYLRDVDRAKALAELKLLIDSTRTHDWLRKLDLRPGRAPRRARRLLAAVLGRPIRYHLRQLAFNWFGQQRNLTAEEKQYGAELLRQPHSEREFFAGVIANAEWFDALGPILSQLLHSVDPAVNDRVVRFLQSVSDSRPSPVFRLLHAQLGRSAEWNNRVSWCLGLHKEWQSIEAKECLLWLARNLDKPWDMLGFTIHNVIDANHLLACDCVKIVLDMFRERRPRTPIRCQTIDLEEIVAQARKQ